MGLGASGLVGLDVTVEIFYVLFSRVKVGGGEERERGEVTEETEKKGCGGLLVPGPRGD